MLACKTSEFDSDAPGHFSTLLPEGEERNENHDNHLGSCNVRRSAICKLSIQVPAAPVVPARRFAPVA
jgi:hypothetical protein